MTNTKKKFLILTASGGGGHLQAARAKYLELINNEERNIIQKDVFMDFLGPAVGGSFAGAWNYCQQNGKTLSLYFFSTVAKYVDFFISPCLGIHLFYQVLRNDIDHIYDTQHEGTKIFLRTLRLIAKMKGKKVVYEKVLTDLPTKKCIHYFKPFKRLSEKDKKYLHVLTTKPLLDKGETEEEFWKSAAALSLSNITYTDFPLRPTYLSYKKQEGPLTSIFNTCTPEHTHTICKCLSFGDMPYTRKKNSIEFTFTDQTLSLITLGSFPQKSVMVKYLHEFIKQKNTYSKDRQDVLFLLTGPQKSSLDYYKSFIKEIEGHPSYPKSLTVVPLAFQTDEALAPLYFNLDFIIAKSGGLTTMELLKAVDSNIFIHDTPIPGLSKFVSAITKHKHDAMLPWERGNANYLIAKKKAQAITPELFSSVTGSFFMEEKSLTSATPKESHSTLSS